MTPVLSAAHARALGPALQLRAHPLGGPFLGVPTPRPAPHSLCQGDSTATRAQAPLRHRGANGKMTNEPPSHPCFLVPARDIRPLCLHGVFSAALAAKSWWRLVEIDVHLPQILLFLSASLFPQRAWFYLFIPQTSSQPLLCASSRQQRDLIPVHPRVLHTLLALVSVASLDPGIDGAPPESQHCRLKVLASRSSMPG